jgi:hypothetical protein
VTPGIGTCGWHKPTWFPPDLASISSGILCDFAQVREGLLFVASGGISRVYAAEVPAPLSVMLALLVEIPPDELASVHEIQIAIRRSDTAEDVTRAVLAVQAGGDVYPGENLIVPAVLDLRGVRVSAHGSYDIRITVDGDVGILLTIYVVDKPPG